MDIAAFEDSPTGFLEKYTGVDGRECCAYVPHPLPAEISKLNLSDTALCLIADAARAFGAVSGMARTLPLMLPDLDIELILKPQLRREAVASTRIEGTRISDTEVQQYEVEEPPEEKRIDYQEVQNYIAALEHGQQLLDSGLPLCVRLVREIHGRLMEGLPQERRDGNPGNFRDKQVVIGGPGATAETARFVPPPPGKIEDLMHGWETFLNEPNALPPLVQCALMHYQFETIHPFTDGNGRVGRLLIKLFFHERRLLNYPLLHLSGFLERHRREYYDSLLAVSRDGDWESWISFFMQGVIEQSEESLGTIQRVIKARETYRGQLEEAGAARSAFRLLDLLFAQQTVTARYVEKQLGVSFPTAQSAIEFLVEQGILITTTPERRRNRIYRAPRLLDSFEE